MTNADYIRSKVTDSQLAEMLDTDNCRTCKARKICKEKYPDGVWKDFDCKRLIKKWLKMEVKQCGDIPTENAIQVQYINNAITEIEKTIDKCESMNPKQNNFMGGLQIALEIIKRYTGL